MNERMQELLKKLSNVGTLIALASAVLFILNSMGVLVDSETVMNVIYGLCSIGVLLGILNNPDTDGIDLPFVKSKQLKNGKGGNK